MNTLKMIWPFIVIVPIGIVGAFASYGLLDLYETAALNKPENFAFPTDGEMICIRVLCGSIILISSVLIIGGMSLGVYYGVHQKKDHLYDKCFYLALGFIFLTIIALPVIFIFSLMGNSSDRKQVGFHYH